MIKKKRSFDGKLENSGGEPVLTHHTSVEKSLCFCSCQLHLWTTGESWGLICIVLGVTSVHILDACQPEVKEKTEVKKTWLIKTYTLFHDILVSSHNTTAQYVILKIPKSISTLDKIVQECQISTNYYQK